jgi:ammonia channel protein AmtB
MINAYWAISSSVVTSIAFSALLHGRIRIKDLMYGTFAGAAIIGTSAPLIFNPIAAILLGMIAGLVQPLLNLAE